MKADVRKLNADLEFYTEEGCFILESSNTPDDPALSIARARLTAGKTTRWHRLRGIVERYVILEGSAMVEVESLPPTELGPGDVVIIPAHTAQRITNTGETDLVFLALCTPRFRPEAYEDTEAGCFPRAPAAP